MAGIKNINVVSGTGNPVQMQDLQNLWSAINSLLQAPRTPIAIVAGFATASTSTGTAIGEGIICFQAQAYYLAPGVAKIGQYLYANTVEDDQRVYEDGQSRYTYLNYVVNASDSAVASGIGTLIGQATAGNLASWKGGTIPAGSIVSSMLADGAVTTPKLAAQAVTSAKIADGAVGYAQIGTEAIKNGNIQDGQITGSKLADQSITGSKLNNKTITGSKLANKTITAEKIADYTITAGQIAAETITNEEIANKTIIANQKLEDGSIEEAQYGTASVSTRALQVNSVNTSIIKDGAVTGSKIADDAISGEKIEEGTIPESKISAPGVNYLEPTTVVPNAMLSNYELNIIKIGNIGSTHVNAIMPVQQLPGTPVRIFIEHTASESAVVDIKRSSVGAVVGTINISNVLLGMYVEIFAYDGRIFYWTSGDANYQRK